MTPRTALLAAWTLFAAAVCAIVIIGAVMAAAPPEAVIPIPVIVDPLRGTATVPLEWLRALIDAHNEQVELIRKLQATTGCI